MNCFNTYNGFAIDAIDGDCGVVLNHLKEVWADNDNNLYFYIINWFAHAIQYPGEKIGTALAMNGQEGSGKGCILNLIRLIMGNYLYSTSDNSVVNKNFNGEIEKKLLVFFDEIGWTEKDCQGKLKQWITEPTISIEGKGIERKEIKSFHNFIFTTNNIRIMNLSKTDRRYVIFKTSNKYCGDYEYFKPFFDKENTKKLASAFYHYLLQVDISNWNPAIIPYTNERQEQIELSKNKVESWIEEYNPFEKENFIFTTLRDTWKSRKDILECYYTDTKDRIRPALFWKLFNGIFETEQKGIGGNRYISIIRKINTMGNLVADVADTADVYTQRENDSKENSILLYSKDSKTGWVESSAISATSATQENNTPTQSTQQPDNDKEPRQVFKTAQPKPIRNVDDIDDFEYMFERAGV
jgi:hypothetical protein